MEIIHAKDETFSNELQADVPVLVDFYADWCGPCRMLAPTLEEISSERNNVKIVKVDVDESDELASLFGIQSIPTVVYIKDKKLEKRELGFKTKEQILANIERIF